MKAFMIRILQSAGWCIVGLISLSMPAHAQAPLQGYELVEALKQGGYVIYFRHASTDHTQVDQAIVDYSDWTTQRNLSEKGQAQAQGIGQVIHTLGIPVSQIISSPYCRCMETSWLAFGKPATPSSDLAFAIRTTEEKARQYAAALRRMLSTSPPAGTNTVLVAHTANLKEAANIWPKPEGIVVVFKPGENGDFSFIGMIKPDQWAGFVSSKDSDPPEQVLSTAKRSEVCGPELKKYADSAAVVQPQSPRY